MRSTGPMATQKKSVNVAGHSGMSKNVIPASHSRLMWECIPHEMTLSNFASFA